MLVQPLLCGAASSQSLDDGRVINGQVQFGDVLSTNLLTVDDAVDGLELTTDATANDVLARRSNGSLHFASGQDFNGYAAATSSTYVAGRVRQPYDVLTTATGNTATAGSRNGETTGESTQTIGPGGGALAAAYNGVDGAAGKVIIDANAIGNTQGWSALRGRIGTNTVQKNSGFTEAKAEAELWRAGDVELYAVAAANNVTADAILSDVDMAVSQTSDGEGARAVADSHAYDVGAVFSSAEASGNSIDVAADGGRAGLIGDQTNTAPVIAESKISAKFFDYAEANAFGVGNSAVLSNVGPKTEIGNRQVNTAGVTARAIVEGGTGNDVVANATASGNLVSGYACTECGGVLSADSSQINTGGVSAVTSTSLSRGRVRSVSGAASAVGNSATFMVQSGN